jgi:hypothetical protein
MIDQYVTDRFPTAIAPQEAWPIMSPDLWLSPARSWVQSNHIPNLTPSRAS